MSDLGAATWSEIDASNTAAPPNGWPEGMFPSDVNNSARANMGGEKRWWDRSNPVFTTAGSSTVYTLTYPQAAASYYDGEIHSFVMDETNGAAATLNVNGLGARQLRLFGGNLLAGALLTGDTVIARYNLAATAWDIIPQNGLVRLGTQILSASSFCSFDSIPSAVNSAVIHFDFTVSADGALGIQTAASGSSNTYDGGGTDYSYAMNYRTTGGLSSGLNSATDSSIVITASSVDSSTSFGVAGTVTINAIQALRATKFAFETTYLDGNGSTQIAAVGGGWRASAAAIMGVRFFGAGATLTGRATMFAGP